MSSKKKLQEAARKFRRENPSKYMKLACECGWLANQIRKHGNA